MICEKIKSKAPTISETAIEIPITNAVYNIA